MDIIDQYIAQKEDQLYRKLATVTDPEIRQLVSDLNSLKRTKEILRQSEPTKGTLPLFQNGNGNSVATVPQMTQGDAAVAAIKRAGRPLHVDAILQALPDFGANATKQTLVSVLLKDRRNRFVRTAPNTFTLRASDEGARGEAVSKALGSIQSNSRSKLPAGFSLIESIKSLLPVFENNEFSQPIVYDLLCRKYPDAAPFIQRASIAAMLGKLAERGFIEVTDKGYGSSPRKYRRKGVD